MATTLMIELSARSWRVVESLVDLFSAVEVTAILADQLSQFGAFAAPASSFTYTGGAMWL